jgi:hypothetical protein
MLSRRYVPPSHPAIGHRSTVIVSNVSQLGQVEHRARLPFPNCFRSQALRRRRVSAFPRSFVFDVPRGWARVMPHRQDASDASSVRTERTEGG